VDRLQIITCLLGYSGRMNTSNVHDAKGCIYIASMESDIGCEPFTRENASINGRLWYRDKIMTLLLLIASCEMRMQ